MEELKPCPFCGGQAKFLINSRSERGSARGWNFGIYCTKCDITTAKTNYALGVQMAGDGSIVITTDERSEAIEAWNRRVE